MKLNKFLTLGLITTTVLSVGCGSDTASTNNAVSNSSNNSVSASANAENLTTGKKVSDDTTKLFINYCVYDVSGEGENEDVNYYSAYTSYDASTDTLSEPTINGDDYTTIYACDDDVYALHFDYFDKSQIAKFDAATEYYSDLTSDLYSGHKVIPVDDKVFIHGYTEEMGPGGLRRIDLLDNSIASMEGTSSIDIVDFDINPITEKVYIVVCKDYQSTPSYSLIETDYDLKNERYILTDSPNFIMGVTANKATGDVILIERDNNDTQQAISVSAEDGTVTALDIPTDYVSYACVVADDGKGLYGITPIDGIDSVYYYDFETKDIKTIFQPGESGSVSSIQATYQALY